MRPDQRTDEIAEQVAVERAETLSCSDLTVGYGSEPVLRRVDLSVAAGEVLALLGPSGSGKSTLLNAVAGFLPPLEGAIWLSGRLVADRHRVLPPEKRDVGVVFQGNALWPHLRVLDTVAYPARRAGHSRAAAHRRASRLLERLGIGHLAQRFPAELSGGEQQRVGLARALAREARLLLFDEPTAHLDTHIRAVFLEELALRRLSTGVAAVYATHDASEALALADRVVLLNESGLVQQGPPAEVYAKPVSIWAARLTGPASVLSASVTCLDAVQGDEVFQIDLGGALVDVPGTSSRSHDRDGTTSATVIVRPDWTHLGGPLKGEAHAVWYRGPHTDYLVRSAGGDVVVRATGPPRLAVGDHVAWGLTHARILPGEGISPPPCS